MALATYERLRHIDKVYFQTHLIAEVRAREFSSYDLPEKRLRQLISTAAQRVCRQLKLLTTSPGLFKLTTVEPTDYGCRVKVRVLAFVPLNFAKKHPATTSPELDLAGDQTAMMKCSTPFAINELITAAIQPSFS